MCYTYFMNKLSENLKQLLAEYNVTAAELARATDVLQPVIYHLISGRTDNPRVDTLIPISKYFNVNVNQLMGNEPIPSNKETTTEQQNKSVFSYSPVPLINDWKEIEKFLSKPDDHYVENWIGVDSTLHKDKLYAVKVKDSTMLPKFTEDTLLIVDPELETRNSDFVIVQLEKTSEPIFKQIFYDGNDVYLKPLNSEFKTILVDNENKIKFLGTVIESRNKLKFNQL